MTPFELGLENELDTEWRRFSNDWLFKWHALTYGGKVDVDRFDGGRIHYSGIKYGDQQRAVFWQAVGLYLLNKVHEVFRQWDESTKAYPSKIRGTSIDGMTSHLRRFVDQVVKQGMDTDSRVRAINAPEATSSAYVGVAQSRVLAEIDRLANAHRALIDEQAKKEMPQLSAKQRIENFIGENKGILSVVSVLIALAGLAIRFLWKG